MTPEAFAHAAAELLDEHPFLSSWDRAELLALIHEEDAKHHSAFVDFAEDDEERTVRLDIAKSVIARWLAERDK